MFKKSVWVSAVESHFSSECFYLLNQPEKAIFHSSYPARMVRPSTVSTIEDQGAIIFNREDECSPQRCVLEGIKVRHQSMPMAS